MYLIIINIIIFIKKITNHLYSSPILLPSVHTFSKKRNKLMSALTFCLALRRGRSSKP